MTQKHLIRCTLCPIQQWNQEAFAGAVIIGVNVTGQSTTSWLMETDRYCKNDYKHGNTVDFFSG